MCIRDRFPCSFAAHLFELLALALREEGHGLPAVAPPRDVASNRHDEPVRRPVLPLQLLPVPWYNQPRLVPPPAPQCCTAASPTASTQYHSPVPQPGHSTPECVEAAAQDWRVRVARYRRTVPRWARVEVVTPKKAGTWAEGKVALAAAAVEVGHVLDEPDDRDGKVVEHLNPAHHVHKRQLLRRRDDHRPVQARLLS
eukprot:3616126-Rhodomonas_salina.4